MVDVPTVAGLVTLVGLLAITAVLMYLAFVVSARQDLERPPAEPDAGESEAAETA